MVKVAATAKGLRQHATKHHDDALRSSLSQADSMQPDLRANNVPCRSQQGALTSPRALRPEEETRAHGRGSSRARRYGRNLTRCVDLKPGPFLIGSPQHEATMTDGRTACAPAPAAQHPGGRRRACRVAAQGSKGRARDRAGRAWDSRDGLQRLVLFTRASSSSRQTGEHLASTWALA